MLYKMKFDIVILDQPPTFKDWLFKLQKDDFDFI